MHRRRFIVFVLSLCMISMYSACGRTNAPGAVSSTPTVIQPAATNTPQPPVSSSQGINNSAVIISETPNSVSSPVPSAATTAAPSSPSISIPSPGSAPATVSPSAPTSNTVPPPAVTPAATPTPTPLPSSTPTPTPVPTPVNLPVVTKSPTDEKVLVGGSCYFVAKYENAIWAVWHFVSPDGTRDLSYEDAATAFPTLKIIQGETNIMQLQNIPETLNGWKVYCRFSNNNGSVDTDRAALYVTSSTDGVPKVTKNPTGETVAPGGSAYFVANHEGAVWAIWHFISPDGTRNLSYSDVSGEFPTLQVINGDRPTMQLNSIPAALNGWKVYCEFRNNIGSSNTTAAMITVSGQPAPNSTTPQGQNTAIYTGVFIESVAKRATMTITGGPDLYNVSITWPNGYAENSTWSFSGSFSGKAVLNYSNCVKITTTYDSAGNPSTVTNYINGSGYIQMNDYGVVWSDQVENVAANTTFVRS